MEREIDLHLLNYYVLINADAPDFRKEDSATGADSAPEGDPPPPRYRCAIEIQDHKRGTSRVVLINEIFRLLDLRHEIHEKAVMHRVVQSANAMFSRALMLMGKERKPEPESLVKLGNDLHALQGEDLFLQSLLHTGQKENGAVLPESLKEAHRIIHKLVDRRVYRPLVIIPGDRAADYFKFAGNEDGDGTKTEYRLRTLGAVVDSPYYSQFLLFVSTCIEEYLMGQVDSDGDVLRCAKQLLTDAGAKSPVNYVPSRVIIWTSSYKQMYKDPAVVVALKKTVNPIDELERHEAGDAPSDAALLKLVKASIGDADAKYSALWKLYVFISDGLYYTGILNKLKLATANGQAKQVSRLKNAEALVVGALEVICDDWSKYCRDQTESAVRRARLVGHMAQDRFSAEWHCRAFCVRWVRSLSVGTYRCFF